MIGALAVAATLAVAQPTAELEPAAALGAYFDGGPFESAQRLVARGRTRQAVRALRALLRAHPDAPEHPQARYLLGVSLIRIERYGEAARLFDELATSYPLLRDEHRFQQGRALFLWGSYLDAARALAVVDGDGPRGDAARDLRARALAAATDFERLARWLGDEEARAPLPPTLRALWAQARSRTGDVLGAYQSYRRVWQEAEDGQVAGRALVGLAGLSIGGKPMLPAAEGRAIRSVQAGLQSEGFGDALAQLERRLGRLAPRGRLLAEVAFARGRIAARRRRMSTAIGHFARARGRAPADAVELRARVALEEGRALEWLGRTRQALRTYETLAARFSDRPESEEALFRAAELQLRSRRYAEARAACEAVLLQNPVTRFRRRCLWSIGWGHYRLGQYGRAREFFSALVKTASLPVDLEVASRYWLARTEAQLGALAQAREGFLAVLRRQPLGYYAALASAQLVDPDAVRATPAARAADDAVPEALVQAREYARLGLSRRALAAAQAYEARADERGAPVPEAAYHVLSELYEELGRRRDARRVRQRGALEHPAALGSEAFIQAARRAHPVEFEAEIRAAAEAAALPPPLLFALVRTESGFRPSAVSAMNAYGLAQLILPTARTVSRQLGLGGVSRGRLLRDPAFNVRLGAAYLRSLLDLYEGSEALALAAYNAGPEAVNAWMSRRVRRIAGIRGRGLGVLPAADELAEEIPVTETRRFVKAVLARKRGYKLLYAKSQPPAAPEVEARETVALFEPTRLPEDPQDGGAAELRALAGAGCRAPGRMFGPSAIDP